jgi:primase-polymerase (primpol)-like protein
VISLDFNAAAVPTALRLVSGWITWRIGERDGRPTKLPTNPHTGGNAQTNNPATWSTFEHVVAVARARRQGIGFVFSPQNPFCGVDLDDCRDPITGALAPWARSILGVLRSYAEVSPSKTGVKVFLDAKLTDGKGRRRGDVEIYSRERYFTVTGWRLPGAPLEPQPRQVELDALVAQLFPPPTPRPVGAIRATTLVDDEILERARRARNGERFARLWSGEWQAAGYGSQSEADLALASMLSFWAGGDAARVDGLFRQSALCRGKWLDRPDYRTWTLNKATQGDIYDVRRVA